MRWQRLCLLLLMITTIGLFSSACVTRRAATPQGTETSEASTPAEPTPTEGVALDDEQEVAVAGYAFQPPAGWTVETQQHATVLIPPDADSTTGPAIVITVDLLEQLNIEGVDPDEVTTLDALVEAVDISLNQETTEITIESLSETTVDEIVVATAPFEGIGFGDIEDVFRGRMAVGMVDDTRGLVMLGLATPADTWQHDEAFDAVLGSLRFFEATQSTEDEDTESP
ncbi:MAG: hypothetical protein HC837_08565 [Chloroflexaceae bacterium]|nr:hypothetical protein [Chloroflexaceae bacterium]